MDILISGAGIAGPALAYWLQRNGHHVTVVERATGLRLGGQAVDLRGAGRQVVERMGLLPAVLERALDQEGMSWVDSRGRVLASMPADAFGGEGFISEIEILRGDLATLLAEATSDVTYVYGDCITSIAQDADGVDVGFESGRTGRFDLVVGADGVSSVVRKLAFEGDAWQPLGCLTAWFTMPDPGTLDNWYRMFNAPGRVASLRPGRRPGEVKAALSLRVDPLAPVPASRQEQMDLLATSFAGLGWHVPEMLEAMPSAPDFALAPIGSVRMPSWSTGRVVLVGDAGACPSPITGLGTSVALVQGYVLAGELERAGGDHERAFAAYERICGEYVRNAQQLPPGGVNGYAPTSATLIRMQMVSMRLATHWPMRPVLEKQFAKAGAMTLPTY